MSDEIDELAPEIPNVAGIAAYEEPEPERTQTEPEHVQTPEEKAFLAAVAQQKAIAAALKNGTLSCLPGPGGYADTEPAVNLATGMRYHGAQLLLLKEFQKQNGFPTAEYVAMAAVRESGIPIRAGQHGVDITFNMKNEESGEWEHRTAKLFNIAQSVKPWDLKNWAAARAEERIQENRDFLKASYGEKYEPQKRQERGPGPEIACTSTDPEKYIGQYLAAVSLGGKFKVSGEQAAEFGKKFEGKLFRQMENGHTNPFELTAICNAAGEQCKAVIKEVRTEQRLSQQQQIQNGRSL
ncbi:MAG: hypothetical protein LBB82_03305 [Treponema sp.]|jgi:hypothetical protein|nr:hypothetical protein [Treponema sp.]